MAANVNAVINPVLINGKDALVKGVVKRTTSGIIVPVKFAGKHGGLNHCGTTTAIISLLLTNVKRNARFADLNEKNTTG